MIGLDRVGFLCGAVPYHRPLASHPRGDCRTPSEIIAIVQFVAYMNRRTPPIQPHLCECTSQYVDDCTDSHSKGGHTGIADSCASYDLDWYHTGTDQRADASMTEKAVIDALLHYA